MAMSQRWLGLWALSVAGIAAALALPAPASAQAAAKVQQATVQQTTVQQANVQQAITSCDQGDTDSCAAAGMMLSDVESPVYDAFLSLRFLQLACTANQAAACGRLALIFYAGEGDVERDLASAANFATRACSDQDRDGCDVAEAIFTDSNSPQFDVAKALRYRRVNCNYGSRTSCIDLARIYYSLNDYLSAEQIALAACKPADTASREICTFGRQLQDRRRTIEAQQQAQRQAKQQAALDARAKKEAIFNNLLAQRDYDGALYYSLYHTGSVEQAEAATLAAARAGALQTIADDHFYVLDFWFRSGPVADIAAAQIARLQRANDCGIFNCSNTPGASSRRWAAQNGRSGTNASSRSSPSYRPSSQPSSQPSSADISRQVRDKYRQYHCGGAVNSSSPTCRR